MPKLKERQSYVELEIVTLSLSHILGLAKVLGAPISFEEGIPLFLENVETAICTLNDKYSGCLVNFRVFNHFATRTNMYWVQFTDENIFIAHKPVDYETSKQIPGHKSFLLYKSNRSKDLLHRRSIIPTERLPLLINHKAPSIRLFARAKLEGLL